MKMEPKDKEVIDLDFDPDILAKYLENLNLGIDIPESLNEDEVNSLGLNFEENCSAKQLSDKENGKMEACLNENGKNKEIDYLKKENMEAVSSPVSFIPDQKSDFLLNKCYTNVLNMNKNFETDINVRGNSSCSISLKNENIFLSIKKEILKILNKNPSDSDTDEEENDFNSIHARGPERNKKRYCKQKQLDKKNCINLCTDDSNFDQQKFLSHSSADIVSNIRSNNLPQVQTHVIPNFGGTSSNCCSVGNPSESNCLYSPLLNGSYSSSLPNVDPLHTTFQEYLNFEDSKTFDEDFKNFILELLTTESLESFKNDCIDLSHEHISSETLLSAVPHKITSKSLNESVLKSEGHKLCFELNGFWKNLLRHSCNKDKYLHEQHVLFEDIQEKQLSGKEIKIIDYEKLEKNDKNRRSNLHSAVLNSNIEKVYCLIEAVKKFNLPLFDINLRDANFKTALDYAMEKKMQLLVYYLKENTAVQGIQC